MTPGEYKWTINLVQDRHQYLNLTYEQAEKVYKYEDGKIYSDKHQFSEWEEWDYELTTFREILNGEQLKIYEEHLSDNIRAYEKSLIEQDTEKSKDMDYIQELINYYETEFLPAFFKDPFLHFGWFLQDKAKIEYLKKEYKQCLDDTKKKTLVNHFRHYRIFRPNELKLSLLRLKPLYILPDYGYFKSQMDEPTKAVSDFLRKKLRYLPPSLEALMTKQFKELSDFNEANFKKHHTDTGGWHVSMPEQTTEEIKEHRVMTILLLDKDKYGYE